MLDTDEILRRSREHPIEGPGHLSALEQVSALCKEIERLAAIAAALHLEQHAGVRLWCPRCEAPGLEYHLIERAWWCAYCSRLSADIAGWGE